MPVASPPSPAAFRSREYRGGPAMPEPRPQQSAPAALPPAPAPVGGMAPQGYPPPKPNNLKTKMCRDIPNCKFGRNCWFAHSKEELVG